MSVEIERLEMSTSHLNEDRQRQHLSENTISENKPLHIENNIVKMSNWNEKMN